MGSLPPIPIGDPQPGLYNPPPDPAVALALGISEPLAASKPKPACMGAGAGTVSPQRASPRGEQAEPPLVHHRDFASWREPYATSVLLCDLQHCGGEEKRFRKERHY